MERRRELRKILQVKLSWWLADLTFQLLLPPKIKATVFTVALKPHMLPSDSFLPLHSSPADLPLIWNLPSMLPPRNSALATPLPRKLFPKMVHGAWPHPLQVSAPTPRSQGGPPASLRTTALPALCLSVGFPVLCAPCGPALPF